MLIYGMIQNRLLIIVNSLWIIWKANAENVTMQKDVRQDADPTIIFQLENCMNLHIVHDTEKEIHKRRFQK